MVGSGNQIFVEESAGSRRTFDEAIHDRPELTIVAWWGLRECLRWGFEAGKREAATFGEKMWPPASARWSLEQISEEIELLTRKWVETGPVWSQRRVRKPLV